MVSLNSDSHAGLEKASCCDFYSYKERNSTNNHENSRGDLSPTGDRGSGGHLGRCLLSPRAEDPAWPAQLLKHENRTLLNVRCYKLLRLWNNAEQIELVRGKAGNKPAWPGSRVLTCKFFSICSSRYGAWGGWKKSY